MSNSFVCVKCTLTTKCYVSISLEFNDAIYSCSSSIQGLEGTISNNQKITEEKLDHQTDIILAECSG